MKDEARLILFAKAPVPGQVKTRLIGALGAAGAAALYRSMSRHCLETACEALPERVELWCSPDVTHAFFAECAAETGCALRVQADGDLGRRMSLALRETLQTAHGALIMGTDVVSITAEDIRAAVNALRAGKDAVVCPTEDGGYGLLGLARHDDRLFADVEWSSCRVMQQTRHRLDRLGWAWTELPTRWDVDGPGDLARLAGYGALAPWASAGA